MSKDINNITCGVLIIYNDSVLLVHNSDKEYGANYSIPKGHIMIGEKRKDCAIRELYEETGIKIDRNKLDKRYEVKYNNKTLYYYIYEIQDLKEIGLRYKIISTKKLQLKEIDWAGFVPFIKAKDLINPNQIKILNDYINDNKKSKYIINYDTFVSKLR